MRHDKAQSREKAQPGRPGTGTRRPPAVTQASLAVELRGVGLRATGPRLAILAHLRSDYSHPGPEAIHAALRGAHPNLSLSTVYETLEAFFARGLCRRVAAGSARMRVDGTVRPHDHAVCRLCGAVVDLDRREGFTPPRPQRLPHGMELVSVHVEYEVICPRCARGQRGLQ